MSNAQAQRPLSEIILDMVELHSGWTDMHVESGQNLMLRKGGNEWEDGLDRNGSTILITRPMIIAFLNGIYDAEESPLLVRGTQEVTPSWHEKFRTENSLHPAQFLSRGGETPDSPLVIARIRCSVQRQQMGESMAIVIRHLHDVPKNTAELGLPPQVRKMATAPAGLILITGPTGSGKSTTIAAIVNEINESRRANIVTIEDPIEFVHERKKSIINQREIGIDVESYAAGVRDALRFVPDVIVLGEIRDAETAVAALRAGESGHLVLATMHAPTCFAAIRSMLTFIAGSTDGLALSNALVGVVAQALVRSQSEGKHKHLAYEVLHCVETKVRDAISARNLDAAEAALASNTLGAESISMFSVLQRMVKDGLVAPRIAATAAHDTNARQELLRMENIVPQVNEGKKGGFDGTSTMVFFAGSKKG